MELLSKGEVESECGIAKDPVGCFRSIGIGELIDQAIEEGVIRPPVVHANVQSPTDTLIRAVCVSTRF